MDLADRSDHRSNKSSHKRSYTIYVGTYAAAKDPGVHVYELNGDTGELTHLSQLTGILNPSFLTLDALNHRLFAVSEALNAPGHLVALSVDIASKTLTIRQSESTEGAAPCFVQLDEDGCVAVVTNYSGGNIALFSIAEDGELRREQTLEHHGCSVHPSRQEAPHPHSAVISPNGQHVYVQDLGTDEIGVYRLDTHAPGLTRESTVKLTPGAGPRHFVFHKTIPMAYVVNELNSTITRFEYDAETGHLAVKETVSTLPQGEGYAGENLAADVHISADGHHLYASNRGHDSIAVFGIESPSGRLKPKGFISTEGKYPRNFTLTPDGRFMIVANQNTDNLVTYVLDQATGMPMATPRVANVKQPVCIVCDG